MSNRKLATTFLGCFFLFIGLIMAAYVFYQHRMRHYMEEYCRQNAGCDLQCEELITQMELQCGDGLDNNNDGDTDCADRWCLADPACEELSLDDPCVNDAQCGDGLVCNGVCYAATCDRDTDGFAD